MVVSVSTFVLRHKNIIFAISFGIKWTKNISYLKVNVNKIRPVRFLKSSINWINEVTNLNTVDIKIVAHARNGNNYRQYSLNNKFDCICYVFAKYKTDYRLNGVFYMILSIMVCWE